NVNSAHGVPLNGKIDKVVFPKKSKECIVYDYKTGKPENAEKKLNPPSEKEEYGGDYWRQMVFYRILLDADKAKNWKMTKGVFSFVEKDKKQNAYVEKSVEIYDKDIEFLNGLIYEVYEKISKHEFKKGCGKKDCVWCNFVKSNYQTELSVPDAEESEGFVEF
ncbi:MAG: PD-(D/E)XK nuclease family protein, partial [Cytophagales bacterium]